MRVGKRCGGDCVLQNLIFAGLDSRGLRSVGSVFVRLLLRGAERSSPQIRDFSPAFTRAYACSRTFVPLVRLAKLRCVSAGDEAGGDEGARRRRSFQVRLNAAMGACIAPAFPVGGMGGSPWWLYVVFRERTCPWLLPHCWHWYLLWEGRKW
jgi:hypothetical protein